MERMLEAKADTLKIEENDMENATKSPKAVEVLIEQDSSNDNPCNQGNQ